MRVGTCRRPRAGSTASRSWARRDVIKRWNWRADAAAVLADAGVSRGSLYHHFPGKDALFLAVLEDVGARIGRQGTDLMRDAPDPVAALQAGCLAWVRLVRDPDRKSTRLNSSHL